MIDFPTRVSYAFRSFFSLLFRGELPGDVLQGLGLTVVATPPPLPVQPSVPREKPADSFDRAVQMLALLQRDGRLVDFLAEDVSPYPDVQLGAAVRSIHTSCRQVLDTYMKLEPIMPEEEDRPVTVPAGFDAASIKLIGNLTGQPPIKGVLRHRGWRVKQVSLPALPQGAGREVVAPAEVEVP